MTATCVSCHKPREILDPTRDACPCGGKCWSWDDAERPRIAYLAGQWGSTFAHGPTREPTVPLRDTPALRFLPPRRVYEDGSLGPYLSDDGRPIPSLTESE